MDGELVGSTPWNGALTSTGEIFAFGQDRCWKGDLDEIALYNKGLAAEDVSRHFAASVPEPSTATLVLAGCLVFLACHRRRG